MNEAALKLARRYAIETNQHEKHKIIAFHKAFHGRTLFSVTAGGTEAYKTNFGPLPAQLAHTTHNNLEALSQIMGKDSCAVILEPIMGEGGIHQMDLEFAQGVRALCDQHQALLIFDEVQTGMGRTGDLFCYQGLGVTPDILTTAKALGNGFPIGAMLTTEKIAQVFQPGVHGTTFGGNPLAAAVAKKVLELVSAPETLAGVRARGEQFVQGLNDLNQKFDLFCEVRGRGLLIGAQLKGPHQQKAKDILLQASQKGLLILQAGPDVLRFAPSLFITETEVEQALNLLQQTFTSYLHEHR